MTPRRLACRSVGNGIFQFREARASQQTLVNDEAPVPGPFKIDNAEQLSVHAKAGTASKTEPSATLGLASHGYPWSVFCDECDQVISNVHFHCGSCNGGDYDLCQDCIQSGKVCSGEGHWLIKRFVKDGKVINSTTERIAPRMKKQIRVEDLLRKSVDTEEVEKQMPGAYAEYVKTLAEEPRIPTRTCNSCVIVLPEREFVTCSDCDDFDLCVACHIENKHGHHPAHGFRPATDETVLPLHAEAMLSPGRNIRHNAICDGCDNAIYGVRHKCLNCPDWDFCSECVKSARHIHPRHRFAAIYQPIPDQIPAQVRHVGIFCDGPLCSAKPRTHITGVRYKCAVCHDTDFCASCEAIPSDHHNRTHPLIKFKMPVRNVSITTENEDLRGNVRVTGDRRPEPAQKSAATETTPVQQANAATQVQTMAEIKPTEFKQEAIKETQPIPTVKSEQYNIPVVEAQTPSSKLNAHFVHDSIADGTVLQPGTRFTQIWTIKNPGPFAWPSGCSVRYVGGDNMLNVDNGHPASVSDIAEASESNVVGREVQVGEEVAFKVILKAPIREGKSISYWRVKAADGTPFGHRLWCDVVIKSLEIPQMNTMLAQPIQPLTQTFHVTQQHKHRTQMAHLQAMREQQYCIEQRERMKKQQQAASRPFASTNVGTPPAYSEANESLHVRLAAMQQKRREYMLAQLSAKREAMHVAGEGFRQLGQENCQTSCAVMPAGAQNIAENDKLRKESAKQRVEYIKAKILRTREEQRAKTLELQKQKAVTAEQKSAEETEKVKKIIEEVSREAAREEQAEAEEKMEGSHMVFPKLDKESPTSSTYQSATSSSTLNKGKAAYVENEAGEVERSAVEPSTPFQAPVSISEPRVSSPSDHFDDLTDDIEVLSATAGDVSEDDGFLTDEEYDILDASDHESVMH